jgi:hypothetical protein
MYDIQIGARKLVLDENGAVTENTAPVAVNWSFDARNHLILAIPGTPEVCDFHARPEVRPLLRTVDAVLIVRPDRGALFEFRLKASWNLTADHKLEVIIGSTKSTIDGYLYDSLGRFRYHFFDKTNLTSETVLGFRGEWLNAAAPGTLRFAYDLESPGRKGTFELTQPVAVEPSTNQLTYTYDKDGHNFKLQLAGAFAYRNLELSYAVQRSQDSDGKPTTLRFGAVLASKRASGTLDFALTNSTGAAAGTTLSLSGGFVPQFRNGQLQLGFRFQQQRAAGGIATNTLLLNGKLSQTSGGFSWVVESDGRATTFGLSVQQIQIGDARAQSGLNVVLENGRLAGVRGMFGVSF